MEVFDTFFKRLCEESFEDLQIVIENLKLMLLCLIKWRPFKVLVELHESLLLIVNTGNGTVSGLRQFWQLRALKMGNEWPSCYEYWRVLRGFCGLLRKCSFETFTKK